MAIEILHILKIKTPKKRDKKILFFNNYKPSGGITSRKGRYINVEDIYIRIRLAPLKYGYEKLKFKETRLAKIKSARESLEKREQELNPGKKIDDKKQISFSDTDSRIMGKKGNYDYRYNGQISVDSDHQIIVGEHLSKNANDKQEIEAALNEIKETTGVHPEKCSIDNGYFSGANLRDLSETAIDVYMATGKGEGKPLNDQERDLEAKS